jgi:uncharacterized SAM-binding protein YcdF (DUF218 family)
VIALVVLGCAATLRLFVWPPLPALPQHADAIIELGGPNDAGRDVAAIDLAREHRAPILIQSTVPTDLKANSCLPPMPTVKIMCFYADPPTTQGEAQYIGRMAAAHHWTSVIIVTTPDQALRAQLRVSRCFGGTVYVGTAPLPPVMWVRQIPYQWFASLKALVVNRSC